MTPAEQYRLQVYKDMLAFLVKHKDLYYGFCYAYMQTRPAHENGYIDFELFPELDKYRPFGWVISLRNGFWFPLNKRGHKKRIRILTCIIAEMEAPSCTYNG